MGQNQSQVHLEHAPDASKLTPPEEGPNNPAGPNSNNDSRRRTMSANTPNTTAAATSASQRRRISSMFQRKRSESVAVVEPVEETRGEPKPAAQPNSSGTFRSLSRFFKKKTLSLAGNNGARSAAAPTGTVPIGEFGESLLPESSPHGPSRDARPPLAEVVEALTNHHGATSEAAAGAPVDHQPSLASGSTKPRRTDSSVPESSALVAEDTPTPRPPPAPRNIAMLAGDKPLSETLSTLGPSEGRPRPTISLDEDPAAIPPTTSADDEFFDAREALDEALEAMAQVTPPPAEVERTRLPFTIPESTFPTTPDPTLVQSLNDEVSATPPLPPIPTAPPTIIPPLPVIPAGTTMIIQGVVQAAEDSGRPRQNRNNDQSSTANGDVISTSSQPGASGVDAPHDVPTLGGEDSTTVNGAANAGSTESDNPTGAAELLGALLIAAASATANMLLSDPPGSHVAPAPLSPTSGSSSSAPTSSNSPVDAPSTAPSSLDIPVAPPRNRSSVGAGLRPRPRTMHIRDGESFELSPQSDRPRPRSLIGSLRDRVFGQNGAPGMDEDVLRFLRSLPSTTSGGTGRRTTSRGAGDEQIPEEAQAAETPARDPIESLRERIANELLRALSQRDTPSDEGSSSTTQPNPTSNTPSASSTSATTPISEDAALRVSSVPGSSGVSSELPAEGTFERFLHDTNAELRSTLLDRMNRRDEVGNVPIPLPTLPTPEGSEALEDSAVQSLPTGTEDAQTNAATSTPMLVHRPAEGVIEPRLNWWRMHRFPARIVAVVPPTNPTPTEPSSSSSVRSITASPSTSTTLPTLNLPSLSPQSAATSQATPGGQQNSTTLIPVIVVGIRTAPNVLVQEIGALAATAQAAEASSSRLRTDEAPTSPLAGPSNERGGRLPWSRAMDPIRALAARRRERDHRRNRESISGDVFARLGDGVQPVTPEIASAASSSANAGGENRDRTRNYLIWVIGGYYPETHPILTSPNLLLNQFDQDDFWGLAELLGQVKPPVASKADIERAGLQVIKGSEVAAYEKDGRVTSNTNERCLICLGDYEPEEDIRIMSCKHAFHQNCVDKWLEVGRNNCPACRTKGVEVTETSLPSPDAQPTPSTSS